VPQPLPPFEPVANEPLALLPVATESAPERQFAPADVLGNFIDQVFGGNPRAAEPAPNPAPTPGGLVPPAEIGEPLTTGSIGSPPLSTAPASGWAVQVGASSTEAGANQLLTQAGDNLAELSDYTTYVQRITRDGQAFYRARFTGFADRTDASAMCEALKRRQINCLAMPG
jgi:D-alanyl-D-alanine carboxypeptidase